MSSMILRGLDLGSCAELVRTVREIIHRKFYVTSVMGYVLLSSKLTIITLILDAVDHSTAPSQVLKSLRPVLDDLERLVEDEVAAEAEVNRHAGSPAWPKLHRLKRLEERREYEQAANCLDIEGLQDYPGIKYPIFDTLEQLQRDLEKCNRPTNGPDPTSRSTANSAPPLADTPLVASWIALHKHLSRNLEACQNVSRESHQMRLLLGTLDAHPTDALRLLCSCPGADGASDWRFVDFQSERSPSRAARHRQDSSGTACELCARLSRAVGRRAVKFCYDYQSLWHERTGMILDDDRSAPNLETLNTWLQRQQNRGHRKALQAILAQWLSRSRGTPWLPQTWNLEAIYLDETLAAKSYLSPYTEYTCVEQSAEGTEDGQYGNIDAAFMIKFAILMLRIEFPKADLSIENEDELDVDDLDECLQGFLALPEIKGELENHFRGVLSVCHNWDDTVPPMPTLILDEIIHPLKEALRFGFGLEVPDLPMQREANESDHGSQSMTRQGDASFYWHQSPVSQQPTPSGVS